MCHRLSATHNDTVAIVAWTKPQLFFFGTTWAHKWVLAWKCCVENDGAIQNNQRLISIWDNRWTQLTTWQDEHQKHTEQQIAEESCSGEFPGWTTCYRSHWLHRWQYTASVCFLNVHSSLLGKHKITFGNTVSCGKVISSTLQCKYIDMYPL